VHPASRTGPARLGLRRHVPGPHCGLALFNPTARLRGDDGYAGLNEEQLEQMVATFEREWGTGVFGRLFGLGGDERFHRWYGKCERLMYSPDEAARVFRSVFDTDVRAVLPTISVPTLVVAHQRSRLLSQSRHIAEHIAGARYIEVRGGDYLSAHVDFVDAVEEFVTGRLPMAAVDRVLATILFTDIVDSTAQAAATGDRAWRRVLDEHDAMVRRQLTRFQGREIKTMGDGVLATFDGPARAVRCGCAIRDEARQLGIVVRAGLHTGEIELRGDDVARQAWATRWVCSRASTVRSGDPAAGPQRGRCPGTHVHPWQRTGSPSGDGGLDGDHVEHRWALPRRVWTLAASATGRRWRSGGTLLGRRLSCPLLGA
jgi:class 3 adenylate cyclase